MILYKSHEREISVLHCNGLYTAVYSWSVAYRFRRVRVWSESFLLGPSCPWTNYNGLL